MEQNLMTLNYSGKNVRTVVRDGEPWWVLVDVCNILGLSNSRMAMKRLDDDEKGVSQIYTLGGRQEMTVINESGLYSVLLRSDKPEAKPFKRWVTHEVLPSIRKTGKYTVPEKLKKLVCDVPDNREAQKIMQEMRNLTASTQILLDQYDCYREESERKKYADVLSSVCGRLYGKSMELDRVKYKLIEKVW